MAGLEILMRFITLLGYAGVLLLLVYYVINGSIGVGAFAAVFSSIVTEFVKKNNVFSHKFRCRARLFLFKSSCSAGKNAAAPTFSA